MKISGSVTLNLTIEERLFWLKQFKSIKPGNDLEKRILKRTGLRLLKKSAYHVPLYPDKECPICERMFAHKVFEYHQRRCKEKNEASQFKVDREILARIEAEV